jgi:3-hydroxyisobutyrate dehydrogenase-like beta-hydroxyacid dehydrogenase
MMVSFSEGLLLSEKAGLDPNTLVEVIRINETEIISNILHENEAKLSTHLMLSGHLTRCYQCSYVLPEGPIDG